MRTDTTRAHHARTGLALPGDLTDAEWAVLEPFFPPPSFVGRPRKWRTVARIGEAVRGYGRAKSANTMPLFRPNPRGVSDRAGCSAGRRPESAGKAQMIGIIGYQHLRNEHLGRDAAFWSVDYNVGRPHTALANLATGEYLTDSEVWPALNGAGQTGN